MKESRSLRIVDVPKPTWVCGKGERTLDYSLRTGNNVLIEDVLLVKTYGRKALGVGLEATQLSDGSSIEPATWYRVVGPPGVARSIQDEFIRYGNRRIGLENGIVDIEMVRGLGPLYNFDKGSTESPEKLMERVEDTADQIKRKQEIVVVDLSTIDPNAQWEPTAHPDNFAKKLRNKLARHLQR